MRRAAHPAEQGTSQAVTSVNQRNPVHPRCAPLRMEGGLRSGHYTGLVVWLNTQHNTFILQCVVKTDEDSSGFT